MPTTHHMEEEHYRLYNPTPSTSWVHPDLTTSSSPTTPKNYYTEWNAGAIERHTHDDGASHVQAWPTYKPIATETNEPYPYVYQDYFAPDFPVQPHHHHQVHHQPEYYSLCIPPQLSSLQLQQATTAMPTQIAPTGHTTHFEPHSPSLSSPMSPITHGPITVLHGHSPTPSASSSRSKSNKTSEENDDDDEYLPDASSSAPSRRTRSKPRASSPFSTTQKHACSFPSCTLAFARARDLKRHFRLHSGELPYKCDGCGRGFIRSDARGRHWRSQVECAPLV